MVVSKNMQDRVVGSSILALMEQLLFRDQVQALFVQASMGQSGGDKYNRQGEVLTPVTFFASKAYITLEEQHDELVKTKERIATLLPGPVRK